jgi:hypothetical protein
LVIATTLTMLLAVLGCLVAAVFISPALFLPAALTFGAYATHLTLATIPGIQAGFRSESYFFGVDTRPSA